MKMRSNSGFHGEGGEFTVRNFRACSLGRLTAENTILRREMHKEIYHILGEIENAKKESINNPAGDPCLNRVRNFRAGGAGQPEALLSADGKESRSEAGAG